MKKFYIAYARYHPRLSKEEEIAQHYDNFNLKNYEQFIEIGWDREHTLYTNVQEAVDNIFSDGVTSVLVLEYEVSEEEMYKMIIDGKCQLTPINHRFFFWDKDVESIKEFTLTSFA